MRNGKYQNKKSGFNVRPLALLLAVVLLVGVSVGGTLAWLTDSTNEVENTFIVGNIDITLEETGTQEGTDGKTQKKDFKMIPGWTIDKDPVVTVKADSEDCWLFVKVQKSDNLDDYISYDIDPNNWTKLEQDAEGNALTGIYYCKAKDITADRMIKVLGPGSYTDPMGTEKTEDDVTVTWGGQQVAVKPSVTKQMMDDLNEAGATQPSLTFTAYAVQLYKNNNDEFTAAEAWTNAQNAAKQQTTTE